MDNKELVKDKELDPELIGEAAGGFLPNVLTNMPKGSDGNTDKANKVCHACGLKFEVPFSIGGKSVCPSCRQPLG